MGFVKKMIKMQLLILWKILCMLSTKAMCVKHSVIDEINRLKTWSAFKYFDNASPDSAGYEIRHV